MVAEREVGTVALVLGSGGGGIGRHVRCLVTGLSHRGVQTHVVAPARTAGQYGLAGAGARVTALDIGGGARDAAAITALRRALRDLPVNVVHAHGLAAGLVAVLARPSGLPLVVTWHISLAAPGVRNLLRRGVARTVAGAAEVTLAVSTELLEAATVLGAQDARRALIAPPALPSPRRSPAGVRAEFGVPAQTPIVLSVGRLLPEKRYDVLIAAAERWRQRRPTPLVLIAGVGAAYRRLAAQAAVARAPVVLTGWRDDVADLLHAADVAVVASDGVEREAFAQEALASGVPLVSTGGAGMAELLSTAAVLVSPGDADGLDAAVSGLLDDPAERARRAAAGLAQARTWPTEAEVVDQVLGIYAELRKASVPGR